MQARHQIVGPRTKQQFSDSLFEENRLKLLLSDNTTLEVVISKIEVDYSEENSFYFFCHPVHVGQEGGRPEQLYGRYSFDSCAGVLDPNEKKVFQNAFDAPRKNAKR